MKKRYLRWFYVLVWALVIFLFSNQDGSASSSNNKFILYLLKSININIDYIFGNQTDYIIRKSAHFFEYFILCHFLFKALSIDIEHKKSILISLFLTFLYACSDEIHQMFVSGRAASFKDVIIDTSGGLLYLIIYLIKNKRAESIKNNFF